MIMIIIIIIIKEDLDLISAIIINLSLMLQANLIEN